MSNSNKYYAGIGSRETPRSARETINKIAMRLNDLGYTLRSGGADGADTFFEEVSERSEIFLPWAGFNHRPPVDLYNPDGQHRYIDSPTDEAMELAQESIRGFGDRKNGVKMLLARNMHQVLGEDLKTPVRFVACWTPGGRVQGGTAHAIRLAKSRDITVYNLAIPAHTEALKSRIGLSAQGSLF